MPINSFLYPGAKVTTAYEVANSCRFNGASDDSLNRTLGTPTNNFKWTISFWLKRTELGVEDAIMTSFTNTQNRGMLLFRTDDQLEILDLQSDSYVMQKKTNRKFRDVSAWYHIVISSDATLSSPETKFYVNGVEETSFATTNEYTQNQANKWNSAIANYIGNDSSTRDFSGYLAEFVFIDGQALAADQFGEFDSDSPTIWKPIDVSGLTFGNNGFYLDFEDSSNLGNDANGGTDFTATNLTAVDQSTDTCTNNFATLSPLRYDIHTLAEGNLQYTAATDAWKGVFSTIGVSTGKFYCEVKYSSLDGSTWRFYTGIADARDFNTVHKVGQNESGRVGDTIGFLPDAASPDVLKNGSDAGGSWSTMSVNDILGMAIDCDNGALYFSRNGVWENSSNPESGASKTGAITFTVGETYLFGFGTYGTSSPQQQVNFGSPIHSISSSNADANGYGNFEYAVPSGYYSLNTKNLAEFG